MGTRVTFLYYFACVIGGLVAAATAVVVTYFGARWVARRVGGEAYDAEIATVAVAIILLSTLVAAVLTGEASVRASAKAHQTAEKAP